jgi:hypothetical protein
MRPCERLVVTGAFKNDLDQVDVFNTQKTTATGIEEGRAWFAEII